MGSFLKCSVQKHKALSLDAQHPRVKLAAFTDNPSAGRWRQEHSLEFTNQPVQPKKLRQKTLKLRWRGTEEDTGH